MEPLIVRLLIREKLANGCLPSHAILRMVSVPGAGETCDGCGGTVTPAQLLMEGAPEACGCGVRFHVECFALWDDEREGCKHDPPGPAS